jgi:phage recombination protein Bet
MSQIAIIPVKAEEFKGLQHLGITQEDYVALRSSIAREATPAEFRMHLMIVARLGLSPVGGMAHFVKRKAQWTTQIGIDGYRSMAEDTKLYQGPAKGYPQFLYGETEEWTDRVYVDKVPYAAKWAVWRKGWKDPVEAVAYYKQYVQRDGDGNITLRWKQAAHPQLAKCAEALALRLAFPRKLGGVYTTDEMAAVDDEVAVKPNVQVGAETNKDGLTPDQEAELKAMNAKLPNLKEGYTGPIRWTLGKLRLELKASGGYIGVKEKLEKDLVAAGVKKPEKPVDKPAAEEIIDVKAEVVQVNEKKGEEPVQGKLV